MTSINIAPTLQPVPQPQPVPRPVPRPVPQPIPQPVPMPPDSSSQPQPVPTPQPQPIPQPIPQPVPQATPQPQPIPQPVPQPTPQPVPASANFGFDIVIIGGQGNASGRGVTTSVPFRMSDPVKDEITMYGYTFNKFTGLYSNDINPSYDSEGRYSDIYIFNKDIIATSYSDLTIYNVPNSSYIQPLYLYNSSNTIKDRIPTMESLATTNGISFGPSFARSYIRNEKLANNRKLLIISCAYSSNSPIYGDSTSKSPAAFWGNNTEIRNNAGNIPILRDQMLNNNNLFGHLLLRVNLAVESAKRLFPTYTENRLVGVLWNYGDDRRTVTGTNLLS